MTPMSYPKNCPRCTQTSRTVNDLFYTLNKTKISEGHLWGRLSTFQNNICTSRPTQQLRICPNHPTTDTCTFIYDYQANKLDKKNPNFLFTQKFTLNPLPPSCVRVLFSEREKNTMHDEGFFCVKDSLTYYEMDRKSLSLFMISMSICHLLFDTSPPKNPQNNCHR